MPTYEEAQLLLAVHRKQGEKGIGSAAADYSSAGPPNWSREAWEGFKQQYGSYPYGVQSDGSYIHPPSLSGAPDWVFDLMGQRRPPGIS